MVVGDLHQVVDRAAKIHDRCQFMDQFARLRSTDAGADDLARSWLTQNLHLTMDLTQAQRFAMIVEGVTGDELVDIRLLAAYLT